jgi:CRISPR-associated protein Cas1
MLVEKISLNFNRTTNYKGKNHTYQSILLDNIQQLANFVIGKRRELQFVIPTTKIETNYAIELRQRILEMSPVERKKLGINKSTLWYQKKHLIETKRIKIYNKVYSKLELAH